MAWINQTILFQTLCLCHARWPPRHIWTQDGTPELRREWGPPVSLWGVLFGFKVHVFLFVAPAKQSSEGDWPNHRPADGRPEADEAASMCEHHPGGRSWYRHRVYADQKLKIRHQNLWKGFNVSAETTEVQSTSRFWFSLILTRRVPGGALESDSFWYFADVCYQAWKKLTVTAQSSSVTIWPTLMTSSSSPDLWAEYAPDIPTTQNVRNQENYIFSVSFSFVLVDSNIYSLCTNCIKYNKLSHSAQ